MSDAQTGHPIASTPRAMPARGRRVRQGLWSVAIVLVLAIATHPWWLAPLVARDLATRSGRAVHFDSIRLGLTPQLAPVAVLRGVRVANAPWGDTSVPFAALDEARFEFAWRRIDGRFVVSKLILRGGETHLERHPDGRRNWRLRQPDDRGPGHYWFDALEAHDASLTFRNPAIDMLFHGVATDAPGAPVAGAAGGPLTTRIVIDGSFRGVDYKGDLLTGPELTFRDTGRWFPARGSAEVAGARLDVDGRAADLFLGVRVDADATLDGRSLAALRTLARRPGGGPAPNRPRRPRRQHRPSRRQPPQRPVRSTFMDRCGSSRTATRSTRRRPRSAAPTCTAMSRGRRRKRRSSGRCCVRVSPARRPMSPTSCGSPIATRRPQRCKATSAAGDPLAPVRRLDADVAFEATHLSFAAFRALQSLKIAALLNEGRLTIGTVDVGWAGGHTSGRAAVDLRQPRAESRLDLQTKGVRLDAVLPQADDEEARHGHAGRRALGEAGRQRHRRMARQRHGHCIGHRARRLHPELPRRRHRPGSRQDRAHVAERSRAAPLPCAGAAVSMQDGRGKLRDLVIDSANTRTTGSGTVDLRDASIDIVLTPQPKRPGIDLGRSIRLHGTLPKPERSLVDRVAMPDAHDCSPARP